MLATASETCLYLVLDPEDRSAFEGVVVDSEEHGEDLDRSQLEEGNHMAAAEGALALDIVEGDVDGSQEEVGVEEDR